MIPKVDGVDHQEQVGSAKEIDVQKKIFEVKVSTRDTKRNPRQGSLA